MKNSIKIRYIVIIILFILLIGRSTFCQSPQSEIVTSSLVIDQSTTKVDSLQNLVDHLNCRLDFKYSNSYTWFLLITILGIVLSSLESTWYATKYNPHSPKKFSTIFWIKENLSYKVMIILSLVILISKIPLFIINGGDHWLYRSGIFVEGFIIGYIYNHLIELFQSWLRNKKSN